MILRPSGDVVHLITQPDHAHLARRVMEHCVPLADRPRRPSILLAIGEHDNGWAEEDAAPVVDVATGAVADFIHAVVLVRQRVWPRGVARLAADPWAAALVAHHAITVYDRFGSDPGWTAFFDRMAASRSVMLDASGGTLADLESDYVFVRLGDLISLTFCAGWTDAQRFGEWTVVRDGSRVTITPDPFDGASIPMWIAAREIQAQRLDSDVALLDALRGAPVRTLRGEAAGG